MTNASPNMPNRGMSYDTEGGMAFIKENGVPKRT